jgi:hypothetical protein
VAIAQVPGGETVSFGSATWTPFPGLTATVTTSKGGILDITFDGSLDAVCGTSELGRLVVDGDTTGLVPAGPLSTDGPEVHLITSPLTAGAHTVAYEEFPTGTVPATCSVSPYVGGGLPTLEVRALSGSSSTPVLGVLRAIPLLAVPAIVIAAFLFGRYSGRGRPGRAGPTGGGTPPAAGSGVLPGADAGGA